MDDNIHLEIMIRKKDWKYLACSLHYIYLQLFRLNYFNNHLDYLLTSIPLHHVYMYISTIISSSKKVKTRYWGGISQRRLVDFHVVGKNINNIYFYQYKFDLNILIFSNHDFEVNIIIHCYLKCCPNCLKQ
jgi:hypothetical protein